jgi:GNAT superfamily N-acetyltransferase
LPNNAITALTFTETAAPDDAARITDLLVAYNNQHTPASRREPLQVVARDATGNLQGGALGWTIHRWAYIDIFVLADAHRGDGTGAKMLAEVERIARARGAVGVYLFSYSFQAPGFYERQGYHEFGRIDGLPAGHSKHWLTKRL